MPDPQFMLVAATGADQATDILRHCAGTTEGQVAGIETAVSRDISQVPLLQHLTEVMPAADVLVGGAMLVLIMLVHAAGVRAASGRVLVDLVGRCQKIKDAAVAPGGPSKPVGST